MVTYAGTSMKRSEDPRLIKGDGSYVDDITLPGMLHAAVLRSPHAYADILSIDTASVRSLPGVVAVLTASDIEGVLGDIPAEGVDPVPGVAFPDHPVLARKRVFYVGQPVAVVVAESSAVAKDALELFRVEYHVLPPVMDPLAAVKPESPTIHEGMGNNIAVRVNFSRGDVDAALAKAHKVVRGQYYVPRLAPSPMEVRGLIAHYQPSETLLTLWSSTQVPHKVKTYLERLLGRPEIGIRVIAPDVGGGFGQKIEIWPEELAFCHLSILLERPIKWIEERWENILAYQARGYHGEIEAAVQADGAILGMRIRMVGDLGGYFMTSTSRVAFTTAQRVAGPYAIHNMNVEALGVMTNKPPTGPYRGAGGPESAFMMERTIDLIAEDLGLDPAEVRRKNFVPPDAFPYVTATDLTYDSGNFWVALQRAMELGEYEQYRQAQRESTADSPLIGVGLATVVKAAGGVGDMRKSSAKVIVEPSGHVVIHTEVSPHGQGTETTFAQIVADELGIMPQQVTVLHGDTALVPEGQGTFASRGLTIGGSAVYLGVQQARNKLARIAGHILECAEDDITFQDGKVFNRQDPERAMSFQDLCSQAHRRDRLPVGEEPGLSFSADFTLPGNAFAFGAHVAVVQIDRDTGEISFLRYAAVHDCGRIINPKLLEGQIHGAMAQGLGQALMESIQYGPDGQPLTGTFMDYAIPTAEELPTFEADMLETPSPINPLGVKGGGEVPTVASPVAVANAVADALRSAGVRHLDAPLTTEKVWRALQGLAPAG